MYCSMGQGVVLFFALCVIGSVVLAAEDRVTVGGKLFEEHCSACHSIEKGINEFGPSLYGIVGRHAASIQEYGYSAAIKASGIVWTEENIKRYLRNPQTEIRCHGVVMGRMKECLGIKMSFRGFADPKEADAVLSYLKSIGTTP